MNKPHLSIVIPIFNEAKSLPKLLREYKFRGAKIYFELICVNNGSTDTTPKILKEYATKKGYSFIRIVSIKKNIGYGYGIMQGVYTANGEVIAWTHADMQTRPSDVFVAYSNYRSIGKNNILIKGRRIQRKFQDSIISSGMAIIASCVLKMNLHEVNAQPKMFHRSFVKYLTSYPYDFMLDLFCLYQANKNHVPIYSLEVLFLKRSHGVSNWAYSYKSRLKMIQRTLTYIYNLA